MEQDIRWLQRYDSYCKACKRVLQVTESERQPDELTELEMEGHILSSWLGKSFKTY